MKIRDILIIILVLILVLIGIFTFNSINSKKASLQKPENEIDDMVIYDGYQEGNAPESESGRSVDKVMIDIVPGTLTNAGATFKIIDKNEIPYSWAQGCQLQIKKENKWTDIIGRIDNNMNSELTELEDDENNMFSDPLPLELDEDNTAEEVIDWTKDYGNLNPGIYRICKILYDNGVLVAYSNEFEIK